MAWGHQVRSALGLALQGARRRQLTLRVLGSAAPVQGIVGADFPCAGSAVPDKCAFANPLDAAAVCVYEPKCQALVIFNNGEHRTGRWRAGSGT